MMRYNILFFLLLISLMAVLPGFAWSPFTSYQDKSPADVVSLLEKKQIDSPDDPEVNYNLGVALYKRGEYAQARQNFERALVHGGQEKKMFRKHCYFNSANTYYQEAVARLGPDWQSRDIVQQELDHVIDGLRKAIERYNNVLSLEHDDEKAQKNLDVVKKLLEELEKKKKEQDKKEKKQEKENKDNNKQKNQQKQEQEKKEQQKQESDKNQEKKGKQDQKQHEDKQEKEKEKQDKQSSDSDKSGQKDGSNQDKQKSAQDNKGDQSQLQDGKEKQQQDDKTTAEPRPDGDRQEKKDERREGQSAEKEEEKEDQHKKQANKAAGLDQEEQEKNKQAMAEKKKQSKKDGHEGLKQRREDAFFENLDRSEEGRQKEFIIRNVNKRGRSKSSSQKSW